MTPELAATVSGARKTLDRFRQVDEEYAADRGPRPDYAMTCFELAAILNNLLRIIEEADNT